MTLIKSISGIRGTLGGPAGENLTPLDIIQFAAAYATWLRHQSSAGPYKVVLGRDARPSGPSVQALVQHSLLASGIDVVDLGLATTPTVEMAVGRENAQGGIIITASHNPVEWNALKLLNNAGEFLSDQEGQELLRLIEAQDYSFVPVHEMGSYAESLDSLQYHIDQILELPYINKEAIRQAKFKVAVDAVNSVGGLAIPRLLQELGVQTEELYCKPSGAFPHNPEPLEEHLGDIMKAVPQRGCDLGIVVDPDVDRLALITEEGKMFGEEYSLVAAADYLLGHRQGPVVSNLSSSRALRDLAAQRGVAYHASAVGEVNVVQKMKDVQAVIGGEGNGGVILPELHYGRDALVGVALILSHLAESAKSLSALRSEYPSYFMAKNKAQLKPQLDVDQLLQEIAEEHSQEEVTRIDGVKIDFADSWVHLRKSNTEPIVRIYAEARSAEEAEKLGRRYVDILERKSQA